MPQRNQEKDSNSDVNLVWNQRGRGSGSKNFDFYKQISEKFQFFQAILQKNIEFCRLISENFDFFRQLKKTIFQAKNCPFTANSGQIILFLFKSNHFRTYFLYMIRYKNVSRPVYNPHYPHPKIGGGVVVTPPTPRIDTYGPTDALVRNVSSGNLCTMLSFKAWKNWLLITADLYHLQGKRLLAKRMS